jgi:hypothetical protein
MPYLGGFRSLCLSTIFSENRFTLFRIVLRRQHLELMPDKLNAIS